MVDVPRSRVDYLKAVFTARNIVGASAHPCIVLVSNRVREIICDSCDRIPSDGVEVPFIEFFDVS